MNKKRLLFLLVPLACICLAVLLMPKLLSTSAPAAGENLLENGGFERLDASGMPVGWFTEGYFGRAGYTEYGVTGDAGEGQYAAVVENFIANDARFAQSVAVESNTIYRLNGLIRAENITDIGMGANLSIADMYVFSQSVFDTGGEWQEVTLYGRTGPDQRTLTVFARLGGYSGESDGRASFDNITLTKMAGGAPAGAFVTQWYKTQMQKEDDGWQEEEAGPAWPVMLLLSLCFAGLTALLLPYLQMAHAAPRLKREQEGPEKLVLALALLAGLVLRIILSMKVAGYEVDINCFLSWSSTMASSGPAGFYSTTNFSDYPPGYLYVLWLNGIVAGWMNPVSQGMQLLNIKFVPILADMAAALLLYREAKKRLPAQAAVAMAVLYCFNPAVLVNGAAWGQVDSVLALGLMLVALYAMERRWDKALPVYMLSVLIKPQALMLGPLGLAAVLLVFLKKGEEKNWKRLGLGLLWSVFAAAVVVVPFSVRKEGSWLFEKFAWLYELYVDTLGSYPYPTVNTANLYYLLGENWGYLGGDVNLAVLLTGLLLTGWLVFKHLKAMVRPQESRLEKYGPAAYYAVAFLMFLVFAITGVDYSTLGTGLMALVILWAVFTFARGKKLQNLPLMGAVVYIGLYVLGIKMHERYLFPALLLLSLSYLIKRDWRILLLLAGFSVTTFLNTAIVLDNSIRLGSSMGHLNMDTHGLNLLLSWLNLFLCGFAFYTGEKLCTQDTPEKYLVLTGVGKGPGVKGAAAPLENRARAALVAPADARLRLTRLDAALLVGITAVYALVAFTNLGSMKAPQTAWSATSMGEQVVFDLGQSKNFTMVYYGGINYDDFFVAVSEDGESWSEEYPAQMREGNCFQWQYLVYASQTDDKITYTSTPRELVGRYVRITADAAGLNLNEVLFRDESKQVLPAAIAAHTGSNASFDLKEPPENLLDEQDTLEGEPGWFTGTYFDEIYHARTAYEHANNIKPYETSHPPLGKVFMSWAVMLFGMVPFGWRFAGALTGVLMLPAMYLMGKQLTRRTDLAAAAMLFMAFDLMHFAQTRIATIDSFPVLFIMLSYLCMFRYVQMDFWRGPLFKTLMPLALSGLFMGLGIASKWVGMYAGAGLAVLFFWSCYRHLREAYEAKVLLGQKKASWEHRQEAVETAAEQGVSRVIITCLFCLLFFVAVPALIYYLSYIPYFAPTGGVTLERIIQSQRGMFSYHNTPGLGADHPYQSPWWEWPLILKPMWYFKGHYLPQGTGSTIYAMGNPAVWWAGLAALVIVFAVFIKRHLWQEKSGLVFHVHTREKDVAPALLLIGFASQYMPWVLVPRSTYIYHYFASVPFIILCMVICIQWLKGLQPRAYKPVLWGLVAISGLLFIGFYPYASGMVTSTAWLDAMRWFPGIGY